MDNNNAHKLRGFFEARIRMTTSDGFSVRPDLEDAPASTILTVLAGQGWLREQVPV